MSQMQDNSAFPLHMHGDYGKGMTLRDYFAAAVLQGLVASKQYTLIPMVLGNSCECERAAYQVADNMLSVRKKAND
jgi:hypothetical protein